MQCLVGQVSNAVTGHSVYSSVGQYELLVSLGQVGTCSLLFNRSPRRIEGRIHQCNSLGVRIDDSDAPELGSADFVGRLAFFPLGVGQSEVGVGAAIGNTVFGIRANIPLVFKSALAQHGLYLIPNLLLVSSEGCCIHGGAPRAVGCAWNPAPVPRSWGAHHEEHHRVIRPSGRLVTADAHPWGTAHPLKRVLRVQEHLCAQLVVSATIIQLHVGIDEGGFHAVAKPLFPGPTCWEPLRNSVSALTGGL